MAPGCSSSAQTGQDRTAEQRRDKPNLTDGLLELPCFLPRLKDQLADAMGFPVPKLGQRNLGCVTGTVSGESFARLSPWHGWLSSSEPAVRQGWGLAGKKQSSGQGCSLLAEG